MLLSICQCSSSSEYSRSIFFYNFIHSFVKCFFLLVKIERYVYDLQHSPDHSKMLFATMWYKLSPNRLITLFESFLFNFIMNLRLVYCSILRGKIRYDIYHKHQGVRFNPQSRPIRHMVTTCRVKQFYYHTSYISSIVFLLIKPISSQK